MNSEMIGIVIVNYNGESYQNEALESIYKSTYENFEVIIVDSHSQDKSIDKAKKKFPNVHYLLQDENVGVAKGNNIGIKYAIENLNVDYILLLNNDVELANDTIQRLIEKADEKTITVPKIYYYDSPNKIWFAGGKMKWKRGESVHIGNFEIDEGQYDKEQYIDYAPTCCMLLNRNIFEIVGYEDELLFMYFDDTDLCVRLLDSGYDIKYIPLAKMWHKVSSSGGGMDSKVYVYYMNRNKLYFMTKYRKRLMFPAQTYTFIKMLSKYILSPIYKKNDKYILKAWGDFKSNRMGRCDTL